MRTAVVLGTNLTVGAGVLGWALYRFGASALDLLARGPRIALLAGVVVAVAATFLGYALRWRILLTGLGARCGLLRLAAFRAAGQSVSWLVPSARLGGEPVRALLLVRDRVSGPVAIASVAVDRTLEMAAGAPFACVYAAVLVRPGVPQLEGALVTVSLSAVALALGVFVAARRLRRGGGVVTAMARSVGLDRLAIMQGPMSVLSAAEEAGAQLVSQPRRIGEAAAVGVAVNLLVMLEYHLLLAAFGLPSGPLAVVAAIFATGAAHSLPVPAAVGALEGAQMWLFGVLGYPPAVGLAVGLAVRLRELVWILPGLLYLLARTVARSAARRRGTAAAKNPA